MDTPQISSPQKTSFWDFWDKKFYSSKIERLLDFSAGFIFSYIIFWGIIILLFGPLKGSTELLLIIPTFIHISFLIYMFFKRKWIFYGILLSTVWIIYSFWMHRIQY